MKLARERFKLSVSVFMFLEKDGDILLLQRENTGWMDGFFSVPAGAIDGDESLEEAVVRETQEEVNVTVKLSNIELVHLMHCFTNGEEWIGVFFLSHKWTGEPKVNEPSKHKQICWVSVTNLPENIIPYVKQAVQNYKKGKRYATFNSD